MKKGRIRTSHDSSGGGYFDVEFANRLARLESYNKHLYRPNTYLHKWWARRCGSTFRMILKSLAGDAGEGDYYTPGGLDGKVVLDPMLGGGTTVHEAIRLGANVVGYDVDPIPVLQARATLTDTPLKSLEDSFEALMATLESRLAPLYTTVCGVCHEAEPIRFLIYGLRQHCDCGEALFVDSLVIRREASGRVLRLCDRCGRPHYQDEACHCPDPGERPRLYEKSVKRCPSCDGQFEQLMEAPYYLRYRPLVVALKCETDGVRFQAVAEGDEAQLSLADQLREELIFQGATDVEPGPKSADLIRRGIVDYRDLFSSRQLNYLKTAIDSLQEMAPQLQLTLALLVSTSLEFNVMLCGYKGSGVRRAGAVRHAFSHHAYSFPYTAVENNPIYNGLTSGSLRRLFRDRVRRARRWAQAPKERALNDANPRFVVIDGEVDYGLQVDDLEWLNHGRRKFHIRQGSAAAMSLADDSIDFVVTDPPYFDSVQYGSLSAFFRVWLRQMLAEEAAGDIDWAYPLSSAAVDSGAENQNDHYLNVISAIFGECQRVLKPKEGRLAFSFHHWKAAGWAAISIALKRSGFQLQEFYVVHSENPISVHIANMNALTDDAILILAGKEAEEVSTWTEPRVINTSNSAAFCRDCALGIGWLLNGSLSEREIASWWSDRLGAHAGRDTQRPPRSKR